MILPPIINNTYIFAKKQYIDTFGKRATPQYGVHLMNGHYLDVSNDTQPEVFYDTINKLSKEVDFISFQEGSQMIKEHRIPKKEKLVGFSFDDGYEECFTKLKPVLDAFKIKAAFFICPNYVESTPEYVENFLKNAVFLKTHKISMTWAQIAVLHQEGHLIGSHTLNHINCIETPIDILDHELRETKRQIEAKLNTTCDHFAYTYGKIEHFSEAALKCAEKYYAFIYSQAGHQNYFSFDGRVLNRRHFEGNWAKHHIAFYLKKNPLLA
jgi:peptidoglycan/xylan/chitin deacetylase (PgdA/CDA1 family)